MEMKMKLFHSQHRPPVFFGGGILFRKGWRVNFVSDIFHSTHKNLEMICFYIPSASKISLKDHENEMQLVTYALMGFKFVPVAYSGSTPECLESQGC